MNNFSPNQMYDSIQARHTDIRNAELARHQAQLAQGEQPNRFKSIVSNIINFAKNSSSQPATETQSHATLRSKEA